MCGCEVGDAVLHRVAVVDKKRMRLLVADTCSGRDKLDSRKGRTAGTAAGRSEGIAESCGGVAEQDQS